MLTNETVFEGESPHQQRLQNVNVAMFGRKLRYILTLDEQKDEERKIIFRLRAPDRRFLFHQYRLSLWLYDLLFCVSF